MTTTRRSGLQSPLQQAVQILVILLLIHMTTAFVPSPSFFSRRPELALYASPPTEWQGDVLRTLKQVIDPDLNADIVTLGFVKNLSKDENDNVSFDVELTTPACPVKDVFQEQCVQLVEALPWVESVQVQMTAQETHIETDTFGLSQVGAIIAVSSCKGGVGKSTTSVNLAFALQELGATVGILDADVYGPSLPTMIDPDDDIVRFVGRQIAPLQRNGVRLMSFGYINDGSAVMRGPMVTQLIDQVLSVTHWGSLDYLIIDMPPGTGDIQLSLTQRLNITAAVIVTTPQELSFADVVRGVEMFDSVNVPSVAVVENMAYYETEPPQLDAAKLKAAFGETLQSNTMNGELDEMVEKLVQVVQEQTAQAAPTQVPIFGPGHKQRLSEQYGIEQTFSMPLLDRIAANGDSGTPYVLEFPDSPAAKIYKELAESVVSETAKVKYSNNSNKPSVEYNEDTHELVLDGTRTLAPAVLRRECRCAACVEELTGRQLLDKARIADSVKPSKLYPTGNYALSVDWNDGHRSLYPYRQIQSILEEQQSAAAAAAIPEKETTKAS